MNVPKADILLENQDIHKGINRYEPMIKHYFKIAVRTLLKNKLLSLINIIGLAVGITAFVLISMYVSDEFSYDRFHDKAERIYRVTTRSHLPQEDRHTAMSAPLMGQWLKDNFPEVENMVRLGTSSRSLSYKDVSVNNTKIWYADSSLFDIFSFDLKQGVASKALVEPYSIVLSQRSAKRYFGDEDPYGKTMMLTDTVPLTVTGVFKDIPGNSHLKMDVILSRTTLAAMTGDLTYDKEWFLTVLYTYVLLNNENNVERLEARIKPAIDKYNATESHEKKVNITHDLKLQPLKDIHLKSHLYSEMSVNGNSTYIYLFLITGILVLLIACANYINLSTARSLYRAKEIGVRKVIGAVRKQLIMQLLGESLLITFFSFVSAMVTVQLLVPAFNTFAGKSMAFNPITQPLSMISTLAVVVVVGIASGWYPALFLSSFSPVKTLNGKSSGSRQNSIIRKGLVIFQFTVSIILIVSVIVIFRQINHMQNKNLGINKEEIVQIRLNQSDWSKEDLIKGELSKTPGIKAITITNFSYTLPVADSPVRPEGAHIDDYSPESIICTDFDFIKTFDVQIITGRNFSHEHWTDQYEALLINESAVRQFQWESPEKALGKEIFLPLYGKTGKVIGIVKDFNFASLHVSIRPLIIQIAAGKNHFLALKVSTTNVAESLEQIQQRWSALRLETPFDYSFMNDDFDKLYRAENQTETIITVLSNVAIFITCLGLFGLAAFTSQQRMKEISIRKVMGATAFQITRLLSKDYILLVLISFCLAIPIAWIILENWLQSFPYRTGIPLWAFIIAGVCSILIAIVTVSFQSIKAALANPVDSLRSE